MPLDIPGIIGAVTRELSTREVNGATARVVTASRTYATTQDDLWDAITSAERIPRWFLPVSGDLRVGGRYQLEGNAAGTVERCDPPNSFASTWEYGGDVTWIELRLSREADGRTRFELAHIARVDDERWAQFGPGAVGVGWDLSILGLAAHLETGSSVAPEAARDWTGSENYRDYVDASSRGWREASQVYGTDPGAATEAADRTTAFYTGSGGHDHGGEGGAGA